MGHKTQDLNTFSMHLQIQSWNKSLSQNWHQIWHTKARHTNSSLKTFLELIVLSKLYYMNILFYSRTSTGWICKTGGIAGTKITFVIKKIFEYVRWLAIKNVKGIRSFKGAICNFPVKCKPEKEISPWPIDIYERSANHFVTWIFLFSRKKVLNVEMYWLIAVNLKDNNRQRGCIYSINIAWPVAI